MHKNRINFVFLIVIILFTFSFCGSRQQTFTETNENEKNEATDLLNKELCSIITADNFIFNQQIKHKVDSLLHKGASINCDCEISDSYISKQIGSGYYFRKFFNRPQKTTTYIIRNPLPHFAYYTNNKDLIDFIKKFKADFNIKNQDQETLLDEACAKEDINSIKELIALGCSPKDVKSIKSNDTKIIDFMLANGASVALIDYNYALKKTDLLNEGKTIQIIKKYNPSFKNKEIDLNQLFFWNENIVLELVKHGMDVNTNYGNKSILAKAISDDNNALIDYILANGFDVKKDELNKTTSLFEAVENNNKKVIDKLISSGCNINQESEDGNIIHACALNKKNGVELADFFYSKKVKIDACSQQGTPLLNAVEKENTAFIKWFLSKKISPNIDCGSNSENPIFEAIINKDEAIIKLLIENGIDLNCKNRNGETPYEYAISMMEFNSKSSFTNEWKLQYKKIATLVKPKI